MKKGEHVRAVKSLGQNFLIDDNIIENIVDGAHIGEKDLVIEIGPGTGALTGRIADRARKVIGIEIDRNLIPVLEKNLFLYHNIEIREGDILQQDLAKIVAEEREKDPDLGDVKIIGNLPYYITTPIIMKVLEEDAPVSSMTVMMQKEVGERVLAGPSTKAYGALSVAVQYYCEVEKICDVSRNCFRPIPKVDSLVLNLIRREEAAVVPVDTKLFFSCIKTAFSMRRKTLLNCFTGKFGMDKEEAGKALTEAGIDPARRGETLTIEEFAQLADYFAGRGK